ncbi:hypothetical protein CEXT_99371 [Caerostris extrusa]|uniref:Uncharacterized protein n=1 Tax=Caerostris extrusa TaxID=172846 RepID=A0AAV4XKC5_CAEEX|nr:hypothetical protein CEXT_99371 [Caerostris extrusa]
MRSRLDVYDPPYFTSSGVFSSDVIGNRKNRGILLCPKRWRICILANDILLSAFPFLTWKNVRAHLASEDFFVIAREESLEHFVFFLVITSKYGLSESPQDLSLHA